MNLTDVSKQLNKQTTHIDKIRLMLEVMQKQIRTSEKHPESIKRASVPNEATAKADVANSEKCREEKIEFSSVFISLYYR